MGHLRAGWQRARWPLAVAAGLLAAVLGARAALGLDVPLGPDPGLWGLAAASIQRGEWLPVPPGYPLLVAEIAAGTGEPVWQVGAVVSAVCAALVPPLVFVLARRAGAAPGAALLAGAGAAALPDLWQFAFQLQPDALATLLLLAVLAGGLAGVPASGSRRAGAWAAAALALALVREHGVVVLAALAVALAPPGPRRAVIASAVAVLGLVALVGLDALPDRLAVPLRESPLGAGTGPPPDYAKELVGPRGDALRDAWIRGDRVAVWGTVVERALARSGPNLLLIALGAAGFALAGRARAGAVPLAPALLVLVVWTQRRHTSVLVPVALVGIAAGATVLARRTGRPAAWLAAGAVGVALIGLPLPRVVEDLRVAAAHGRDRAALAEWMAAQPGPWFLGGRHNEVNLHLLWPRHDPALPPPGEPLPASWSGTDWRTQWVAPVGAMPPPFTEAHRQGDLAVFRLEPAPGQRRPCTNVRSLSGPLFAAAPVQGRSAPTCSAEAWFGQRPEAPERPWQGHPWVPGD